MGRSDDCANPGDSAFDLALGEYLRRLDAGEKVDRAAFVAAHPDVAPDLRAYFATAEMVERFGATATDEDSHSTLSIDTARGLGSTETVPPHPSNKPDVDKTSVGPEPEGQPFGRYRLERVLGQGAMGIVHLAHDTELDRQVALKIPRVSTDADPEVLKRFYRESRAAAKLDHPNICSVYDVGQIDGLHYLVMAYVEGQPLSKALQGCGRLSAGESASIVLKLAWALAEAHERGIVHRDLKPSNIMVNRRGEPVVMDFGLAQLTKSPVADAERLTQTGTAIGTPAYMSPEQVTGDVDAMGPACDVYSLGVIMYELLTGRLPFQGTVASVLGQIMVSEPIPPTRLQPDIDPQLEAICLKAMAKSIDARFTSMADMASALEAFVRRSTSDGSVESAAARRTDSLTKVSARPRRSVHGWIAAAIAAACVGMLAAVIYRVITDKGTLVVEIDDPEIEAKLLQSGLIVRNSKTGKEFSIDVKGSRQERSGTYMVVEESGGARGVSDHSRLRVEPGIFILTRGGTVTVRVTLEPPAAMSQDKSTSPVVGTQSIGKVSSEREIAAWVLGVDGRLRVELSDGRIVAVDRPSDLPDESFRVDFVFLSHGSKFKPEDVKRLAGLAGLRAAQLERYSGFDDDIFVPFRRMPRFEGLHLRGESQLTGAGLTNLEGCTALRSLELNVCQLTDAACETIARMTNLKHLEFSSQHVTVRGFEQLAKLSNLEVLNLPVMKLSPQAAEHMKRARNLRHLQCIGVTDEVMPHIGEMRNLTELWLPRSSVTDEGLKPIENLTKLTSLVVQDAPIRGSGLERLRRLPLLTHIDLAGTEIDESAWRMLGEMVRLQSLVVNRTRIQDSEIVHLAKLSELIDLRLSGTQVTDAAVPSLSKLTKLNYLEVSDTRVTREGLKALRVALPKCKIVPESPR